MSTADITIMSRRIPWVEGLGAVDGDRGDWGQLLADSDKLGWRLSLYDRSPIKDSLGKSGNTVIGINEYPIIDLEDEPVFDVRDIKTPDHIDSTFGKTFKKYFG